MVEVRLQRYADTADTTQLTRLTAEDNKESSRKRVPPYYSGQDRKSAGWMPWH